jgi:hypothetical protein
MNWRSLRGHQIKGKEYCTIQWSCAPWLRVWKANIILAKSGPKLRKQNPNSRESSSKHWIEYNGKWETWRLKSKHHQWSDWKTREQGPPSWLNSSHDEIRCWKGERKHDKARG